MYSVVAWNAPGSQARPAATPNAAAAACGGGANTAAQTALCGSPRRTRRRWRPGPGPPCRPRACLRAAQHRKRARAAARRASERVRALEQALAGAVAKAGGAPPRRVTTRRRRGAQPAARVGCARSCRTGDEQLMRRGARARRVTLRQALHLTASWRARPRIVTRAAPRTPRAARRRLV